MRSIQICLIFFFGLLPYILGQEHHCIGPGGIISVPVNDKDVVRLRRMSVSAINRPQYTQRYARFWKTDYAKKQLSSGTIWKLGLQVRDATGIKPFEVTIWEQDWLNRTQITIRPLSQNKNNQQHIMNRYKGDDISWSDKRFFEYTPIDVGGFSVMNF